MPGFVAAKTDAPNPQHGKALAEEAAGDLLAVMSAGAYGFVMASNYNTRAFPAEILVKGNRAEVVRKRQSIKQLWASESIPNWLK